MHAWIAVHALALLSSAPPCTTNPHVRRLDFWLGDWVVQGTGTSRVSLSLDRCVFTETWTGARHHRGENVLAYSVDDSTWRAFFADNEGRVHVFSQGRIAGDTAEFLGDANRILIIREGPDRVKQIWEKSGTVVFAGDYTRRRRAPLR